MRIYCLASCNVGDLDSVPGLGRFPAEGNGYPLQYSGRENSMDCIFHGPLKSPLGHPVISTPPSWNAQGQEQPQVGASQLGAMLPPAQGTLGNVTLDTRDVWLLHWRLLASRVWGQGGYSKPPSAQDAPQPRPIWPECQQSQGEPSWTKGRELAQNSTPDLGRP